jgi:hypothetical protein
MLPQLDMILAQQHIADMRQQAARIRLARHAADTAPRSQRPSSVGRIQTVFDRLSAPFAHAGI